MFTGLVEAIGTVTGVTAGAFSPGGRARRLCIASSIPSAECAIGDSVAIDGCCLTVVEKTATTLSFDAATETLERTTLGSLASGHRVNLERALRLGDRLGGHMVSGHVDGVGQVISRQQRGSALYLGVRAPSEVSRLTVGRGSITLAGVSLTVTGVEGDVIFVGLIPHTLSATTLESYREGDALNLEADIIARYVERLMAPRSLEGLTLESLKAKGFA